MADTLLIGFGNDLRGDDGLGRRLAESAADWPGVRALSVHQLTPELALELLACRRVIFADAVEGTGGPRWRQLVDDDTSPAGWHHSTPEGLLHLCRALYGRAPEAWLLALPGQAFGAGSELSPAARRSLEAGRLLLWGRLSGPPPSPAVRISARTVRS